MNKKFFPTNNYYALGAAVDALKNREPSLPGLGLVYGKWGLGKSDAIDEYYRVSNAYCVRAERLMSARDLLEAICEEYIISPEYRTMARYRQVCSVLKERGEPLFIDEADYLFKQTISLDMIRDMHDRARVPIILVGMEEAYDRLAKHGQFWSRILPAGIVNFQPLMPPEITLVTKEWTGLDIPPECAERVCQHTMGDWRLVVGHLVEYERACRVNQTQVVAIAMVEAVIRQLTKRKGIIDRHGRERVKQIYSVGRKRVTEASA